MCTLPTSKVRSTDRGATTIALSSVVLAAARWARTGRRPTEQTPSTTSKGHRAAVAQRPSIAVRTPGNVTTQAQTGGAAWTSSDDGSTSKPREPHQRGPFGAAPLGRSVRRETHLSGRGLSAPVPAAGAGHARRRRAAGAGPAQINDALPRRRPHLRQVRPDRRPGRRPGPRCASRACPPPYLTSPPARCDCWSTTAKTLSGPAHDRRGTEPARRSRRRRPERRQDHRRGRRRQPNPQPPRLRATQRDGPHPGVVIELREAPAEQDRQSAAERRYPPHRPDPGSVPARSPRIPREARSGRSHPEGSPALPQETDLRRHLPRNARRRNLHRTRQHRRRFDMERGGAVLRRCTGRVPRAGC